MKLCALGLAFLGCSLQGMENNYEFKGKHFIASYKACNSNALRNVQKLREAFAHAVQSSKATILDSQHFVFPGDGFTATFILSESHASIHTYPEHNACFVDLFTCGDHCSWEQFNAILEEYLKPGESDTEVKIRS